MKKIVFIAMALICAYAISFAQSKAPAAVIKAFNQKFPNALNVSWDKENAHEYEASFKLNNQNYSANFSETGIWLETESPVTFNELPANVQKAFNASHKGSVIKDVAKIENSKGLLKYELEIKKGLKTVELFYSPDGKEVSE